MARLPYFDPASAPEIAPVVERITRERGGRLLNLYRMLLHSPPLADGWRALFTAIRQQAVLSGRVRELVILYIAVLNGADYEFDAHVPFALRDGLTQTEIDALRTGVLDSFDAADRAILAYCCAMTRDVRVSDDAFAALRPHFNERELVELTATIAGYNLVSRFLVAMAIDHE
jgi:alkylhydroperoxidase family enzyme